MEGPSQAAIDTVMQQQRTPVTMYAFGLVPFSFGQRRGDNPIPQNKGQTLPLRFLSLAHQNSPHKTTTGCLGTWAPAKRPCCATCWKTPRRKLRAW